MKLQSIVAALPMLLLAGQAQAALGNSAQNGLRITWNTITTPATFDRVAACPIAKEADPQVLYAWHTVAQGTHNLYKSTNGGGSWTLQNSLGPLFSSLACGDESTSIYAFNEYDNKLYGQGNSGAGQFSVFSGVPAQSSLQALQTGIVGIFTGGAIKALSYVQPNPFQPGAWSWVTQTATATSAARIAEGWGVVGRSGDFDVYGARAFARNFNGNFYYLDGGFSKTAWKRVAAVNGDDHLDDISASYTTRLFATTTEGVLYRARFREDPATGCTDNIDNDLDGVKDGSDPDCP